MDNRELPQLLAALAERGLWRTPGADFDSRVPIEVTKGIDPDELGIHLEDSFHTVGDEIENAPTFWNEYGRLDDPAVEHFVIIGDFGIGSDSPIVLDYQAGRPVVRRLAWLKTARETESDAMENASTYWELIAPSFDDFARMIGADRWLPKLGLG